MSNDEHTTAEIDAEAEGRRGGDDDTEGHRFVPTEERLAVGDTPSTETAEDDPDDPDDTDGHRLYARNVGASFDDESAEAGDDADTAESSDTPADNTAAGDTAADADPDDTDGHRYLSRNVGVVFD